MRKDRVKNVTAWHQRALVIEEVTMATRLEALQSRLAAYLACEEAILGGAQSYGLGTRNLTRANLQEIAEMVKYLEKEIAIEESKAAGRGRNAVFGVVPRDF